MSDLSSTSFIPSGISIGKEQITWYDFPGIFPQLKIHEMIYNEIMEWIIIPVAWEVMDNYALREYREE